MNKTELIQKIATISGLTQKQASEALNSFCTAIKDELAHGGEVTITGFGTFSVVKRAERMGRNPKTGETLTIAASQTVKFKAGKNLKEAVN